MAAFIASYDMVDKPLPVSPPMSLVPNPDLAEIVNNDPLDQVQPIRRISRLRPINLTPTSDPQAGPSNGTRYLYVAVRSGRRPGVYTDWQQAEVQLLDHPNPVFKTFSTKMAAEAYVNGWNGAGRHSVPGSCPKPLREHLAMNFPSSVPLSSPSKRSSYHSRLVASAPALSALPERPPASNPELKASFRRSQVRISSPLRQQVDEEGPVQKLEKKSNWVVGMGGLLSPPASPQDALGGPSVMDRERPTARRAASESGTWSSTPRRDFSSLPGPKLSSRLSSTSLASSSGPKPITPSGLWADAVAPPIAPSTGPVEPDLASSAPKFSRSKMKQAGVIMPTAAPRSNSSSSLRSRLSRNPSSTSISSLASSSSSHSTQTLRRPTITPKSSQDRLYTLAETSRQEMQLEDAHLSLGQLAPPRPAFMRRSPSSSSVSSEASDHSMTSMGSMSSLTSASSCAISSIIESCSPIEEETVDDVIIRLPDDAHPSCTKSDGDALSQSDRLAKPKKGGLFKRLSRALRMEKSSVSSEDSGRRGSM